MNWSSLERLPGLLGTADIWRRYLASESLDGEVPHEPPDLEWEVFQRAFLQRYSRPARFVPCPRACGCAHEVVCRSDGERVGVCRCKPWNCEDLTLTVADTTLWQLSQARLGRALRRALELRGQYAETGLPNTAQIGGWSVEEVPVLLTLQNQPEQFASVAATLVARFRRRFILLAPTNRLLTPTVREHLTSAEAGFFPLETTVRLTHNGTLQPVRPPGELFSRFNPQPSENLDADVASRAFALLEQLDSSGRGESPNVLTVFRLYCVKEMTAAQIAKSCKCSKTTVLRRLQSIASKTGVSPLELRRLSPHISKMRDDIADAKAERIRERNLIYDDAADEETER